MTLIARNSQEIVDHVSFNTIGCEACLVGHFGIIGVEVLGECNHRLLDELQVSVASHDNTKRDGFAGLHLSLVNLCRDVQAPHST